MKRNYFIALLEELEIPYTPEYADELFSSHPYRYTLFGLRSMLRHYGVASEAVKIEDKKEALGQLANNIPFVVELQKDVAFVVDLNTENVEYTQYGKSHRIPTQIFEKIWTGAALIPTDISFAEEPDFKRNLNTHLLNLCEKYILISASIFLITFTGIISGVIENIWLSLQLLCSLCGIWLSSLLVKKSMNLDSFIGDRVCRIIKGNNCHDILLLPVSKLFGRYGWAEIGIGYFSVSALLILTLPDTSFSIYPWICICSMIYPFWSIAYQKLVAKRWCPLCLGVQAIILIQSILAIIQIILLHHWNINILSFIIFGCAYLSGILIVHMVCRKISFFHTLKNEKEQLIDFKYNADIMDALLTSLPEMKTGITSVVFGEKDAKYQLTIFSNPFCGPCSKIHPKLEALIEAGCSIRYFLNAFDDKRMSVSLRMIAFAQSHTPEEAWKLFDNWYSGGKEKGEEFFEPYNISITESAKSEFSYHQSWAEKNELDSTPTIFLNNKKLPIYYSIDDILKIVKYHE